jgi:hypothetical protein
MKFVLTIDSDNDDNGPEMVAENLESVVAKLDDGVRSGSLRDRNGNTVGAWEMTES